MLKKEEIKLNRLFRVNALTVSMSIVLSHRAELNSLGIGTY